MRDTEPLITQDPNLAEAWERVSRNSAESDQEPCHRCCVESCQILGKNGCLWIKHNEDIYCLRLTKRNRLILTK